MKRFKRFERMFSGLRSDFILKTRYYIILKRQRVYVKHALLNIAGDMLPYFATEEVGLFSSQRTPTNAGLFPAEALLRSLKQSSYTWQLLTLSQR